MEALGAVSAILGLITGSSGIIRDWKAAPTALVSATLIAGAVALFVAPGNSTNSNGRSSSSGNIDEQGVVPTPTPVPDPEPEPEPVEPAAPSAPPVDPQSTEEYQVCVAYAGYGQWQCDSLLDEAIGASARTLFRSCVEQTEDATGCVDRVYAEYGGG